jgi:predicted ABC-type ATPase
MLHTVERHIIRVAARPRRGGRDIPEQMIRQRFVASFRQFARLERDTASIAVYDNSIVSADGTGATATPTIIRARWS